MANEIMNNSKIQVFVHPQFGSIRTCQSEDKVWFCLSDVCKALAIGNASELKKRLQKRGVITTDTPTQNQHGAVVLQAMSYIDEPNLYRTIFQSRKNEAVEFQNWVYEEVLPQIRKTGGYIPVQQEDDEKTILCKALMIYKKTVEQQEALVAQAHQQLEEQKPMVNFAKAITASETSILIGDLAKLLTQNGYEIGRTRLFTLLRNKGYLFKHENRPIQEWVEKGLFEIHETLIETHHGSKISITTKVTAKGQQYFIHLFTSK